MSAAPVRAYSIVDPAHGNVSRELQGSREKTEANTRKTVDSQNTLDLKNRGFGDKTRPATRTLEQRQKEAAQKGGIPENERISKNAAELEQKIRETTKLVDRLEQDRNRIFQNLRSPNEQRQTPSPTELGLINLALAPGRNTTFSLIATRFSNSIIPNLSDLERFANQISGAQQSLTQFVQSRGRC